MAQISEAFFLIHLIDGTASASGVFPDNGISISEWCTLKLLMQRKEQKQITHGSTLASFLGVSRQRGKQLLDSLAERGLVSLADAPENARLKLASATTKGQKEVAGVDKRLDALFGSVLGDKATRLDGLVKFLKRVEISSRREAASATKAKA